jgi:hypothetical protein
MSSAGVQIRCKARLVLGGMHRFAYSEFPKKRNCSGTRTSDFGSLDGSDHSNTAMRLLEVSFAAEFALS